VEFSQVIYLAILSNHRKICVNRDTRNMDNIQIVANELAVSAVASSLVRRCICPNFLSMHRVFTCAHAPPASHWGCESRKKPKGGKYDKNRPLCQLKTPKGGSPGRYQYIQMELANEGDAEELIKRQKDELLPLDTARFLLFQVAFALFAAAEKYSIKHYDIKLLNIFVHKTNSDLVLRYGLGSHVFAMEMTSSTSYIAKLADFGTSNMEPSTCGLPVTISNFTTLENTPPDFLILGDNAKQGHGHDNFGLGLVMLHLYTGFRPYEEILEDVHCPPNLKERLRLIWESEKDAGYSVIRTLIFDGVDVDEYGNVEGEKDYTLYDTLYRYLVLFGIPKHTFLDKDGRHVWNAITDSLLGKSACSTNTCSENTSGRHKSNRDSTIFNRDSKRYSIRSGTNKYIARARHALSFTHGGLDLLYDLCNFDPSIRATAMDVLNSKLMEDLREHPGSTKSHYGPSADVRSYVSFSTL
jgi:Protein kinase domain